MVQGGRSLRILGPSGEAEGAFHRVAITPDDELVVDTGERPVAIWVPSGYQVRITARVPVVLDCAEMVEHHDVVSMDLKLREKDKLVRRYRRLAWRSRRRLRR